MSSPPSANRSGGYLEAAAYSGIGGVLSRILQGLVPVVAARLLIPQEFGAFNVLLALGVMVTTIANFGHSTALQRFLPQYAVTNQQRGWAILQITALLNIVILGVVGVGIFFSSPWLARAAYRNPGLTDLLRAAAPLIFLAGLFNLATTVLAGLQEFRKFGSALVVRSTLLLLFTAAGAWLLGLWGAVVAHLLAVAVAAAFAIRYATRRARERLGGTAPAGISTSVLKEILHYTIPAVIAGAVLAPAYWWATAYLVRTAGLQEMGIFGVAFTVCQLVLLIPTTLSVPSLSYMAERHTHDDGRAFGAFVHRNVRLIWALSLPLAVGIALLAPFGVRLVFGAAYEAAGVPAAIMSFVALMLSVNGVMGNAIAASGRIWQVLWLNLGWLVLFVVACGRLVPQGGAVGLAGAFFFSYLLFTLGVWLYSRHALRLRGNTAGFRWLAIFSGLCIPIVWCTIPLQGHSSAIWLHLGMILLLILAEWFLVLDRSERQLLWRTAYAVWLRGRMVGSGGVPSGKGIVE